MIQVSVILNYFLFFSFSQSIFSSAIFPRLNLYQCHQLYSMCWWSFPAVTDDLFAFSHAPRVSPSCCCQNNDNFLQLWLIFLFKTPLLLLLLFAVSWTLCSTVLTYLCLWFFPLISCSPHTHCRFLKPIHFNYSLMTLHLFLWESYT